MGRHAFSLRDYYITTAIECISTFTIFQSHCLFRCLHLSVCNFNFDSWWFRFLCVFSNIFALQQTAIQYEICVAFASCSWFCFIDVQHTIRKCDDWRLWRRINAGKLIDYVGKGRILIWSVVCDECAADQRWLIIFVNERKERNTYAINIQHR